MCSSFVRTMKSLFRKLRWLTQRSDKKAELRDELRFHLEEEAQQRQERTRPDGQLTATSAMSL
jgi:hypothetical protein